MQEPHFFRVRTFYKRFLKNKHLKEFIYIKIGAKLYFQALHAAIDAHATVFSAVEDMGRKMGSGMDSGKEKTELLQRMDRLTERWTAVKAADDAIK